MVTFETLEALGAVGAIGALGVFSLLGVLMAFTAFRDFTILKVFSNFGALMIHDLMVFSLFNAFGVLKALGRCTGLVPDAELSGGPYFAMNELHCINFYSKTVPPFLH